MKGEESKKKRDLYISIFILQNEEGIPQASRVDQQELQRVRTWDEAVAEMKSIGKIAAPTALAAFALYLRAMISTLFLGHLGDLELAAGSLATGFANITGYSIISGLSMGMEPICGQAFGAERWNLVSHTLQRTVLILLSACLAITFLWLKMEMLLLWMGQDPSITSMASKYLVFLLPDLFAEALVHPIKIYLRSQGITLPLATCAALALGFHVPINFFLVDRLNLGIKGVALATVWTNYNLILFLLLYICLSGAQKKTFKGFSSECLRGWTPLLKLCIPSCVSVCLEWWWYELMTILCGLMKDPTPKVAAMGILIQTTSLLYIFPSSFSFGVSTRIENELGATFPARARKVMVIAVSTSAVMGLFSLTFATSLRSTWGKIFTGDSEILTLTCRVLPIIGLCELFNCPQTTSCGVLRGCARPWLGACIYFASFYLLGMPVAMCSAFPFKMGFPGLWLGLLTAEFCCLALMSIVLVRTDWTLQADRAATLVARADETSANDGDEHDGCDDSNYHGQLIRGDFEDRNIGDLLENMLKHDDEFEG